MDELREILDNRQTMTYVCAGAAALSAILYTIRKLRKGRESSSAVTAPPGTVILHRGPYATLAPSLSPFPIKLEMFLRLANIPYVNDHVNFWSPKGKVPYITFNGQVVSDSELSIEYLKAKLGIDLDKDLTPEQKAVSQALKVMVDEHIYWTIAYFRWVEKHYHQRIIKENFRLPALAHWMFKRKICNQAWAQGMGRHTREEVLSFAKADIKALDGWLGDKDFMMGDQMTQVDCSVFGMLCQLIYMQDDDYLQGLVQSKFPRLVRYTERVKAKVWPDWEEIIRKGSKAKQS